MKRIQLLIIFTFSLLIGYSQVKDTLFVYTKHDCSVCKQTKQVLQSRGVSFFEKDVASTINASEMLNKLAASGYKGSIYMPVMYIGKKLMHPAYSTDSGLINLDINIVIDSIVRKHLKAEIAKVTMTTKVPVATNSTSDVSDCEHTSGAVYLVVANYPVEREAVNAVQLLIKNGYPNAGFVHVKGIFKVYSALFPDYNSASAQLPIERFKFTDAYLLPMGN